MGWLKRAFKLLSVSLLCSLVVASPVFAQITPPPTTQPNPSGIEPDDKDAIFRDSVFYKAKLPNLSCGSSTPLAGSDNVATIYNFLLDKGFKDFQVAGIMGNIFIETSRTYEPETLQGKGGVKTPYESLTSAEFTNPALGWGLVQWTPISKFTQPTVDAGKDPNNITVQLEFLVDQLEGRTSSPELSAGLDLKETTDVVSATTVFEMEYERHRSKDPQPDRVQEAQRILDLAHQGGLPSSTDTSSDSGDSTATGSTTIPTVVIDPGHSGAADLASTHEIDPASLIESQDNDGAPQERQIMWESALQIKAKLEKDGYKVVLTKQSADDEVGLATRAKIANDSNAAIAVSLHYTGGAQFGVPNDHWGVTPQEVGRFRENINNGKRKTFDNASVAEKSQSYAQAIAEARSATGDNVKVAPLDKSFPNDRGQGVLAWGDISIVQLLSVVPWIYNEAGANGFDQQKYVDGISNGIEKAVPSSGLTDASDCASGGTPTGFNNTVLAYAWPDYHTAPFVDKTPAYEKAVQIAQENGQYVGDRTYPGVDCGAFVTRFMIDSGYEPGYNYGGSLKAGASLVAVQHNWLDANWQKIGAVSSSSELKPGDVAIINDDSHTYVFVGQIPGFNSVTASASVGTIGAAAGKRAPMASPDNVTARNLIWYRKK